MKRSHDIGSINTLPFAHPFGLHLLAPQMRPSSSEPSPRHYQTTPRPLRSMAACLRFFHFNHLSSAEGERGGTGALIHGCDRGAVFQRGAPERWQSRAGTH